MWYKIEATAMCAAKEPLKSGRIILSGPCLSALMREVAERLHGAVAQVRETAVPHLEGLLLSGLEIQVWDCWTNYEQHAEGAEDSLRAMRRSVIDALVSGRGSSSTGTPTSHSDSCPN